MLHITRADVWATTCEDQPGGMLAKLEPLVRAGADLQFVLSRRLHEEPGRGVVFVTPLQGERQLQAAENAGWHRTRSLHSLRVEAPDEPGTEFLLFRALGQERIDLRGVSAMAVNGKLVVFLAFSSEEEAEKAEQRLQKPL